MSYYQTYPPSDFIRSLATSLIANSMSQEAIQWSMKDRHRGNVMHADFIFVSMEQLSLVFISYLGSD